uniref:(northern house mosquito) hypothetical protein n=1 Tax=Culex pipiens TaxID=7175 RepID=A0A8D8NRY1_CULPI
MQPNLLRQHWPDVRPGAAPAQRGPHSVRVHPDVYRGRRQQRGHCPGHAGKLHPGQVRVVHGQWLPGRVPAGGGSVPHPGRWHVVRHHVGTGHLLQRDPVTRHDGQIAQTLPGPERVQL